MMACHLRASSLLVGLALVTLLGRCDALRRPPQRHDALSITPSEPSLLDGGWRPVIDSRSSYEPSTHEDGDHSDHTIDLVPPPIGGAKGPPRGMKTPGRKPEVHVHKHEPPHFHKHDHHVHSHHEHTHKPKGAHSDLKVSETRTPVTGDGNTGTPSRPMRFPDQKGRIPEQKGRIPEQNGRVPEHKVRIPEQKGRVPEHKGRIPEQKGRVPAPPNKPRRPSMPHHHHPHHHHLDQSADEQNFNIRQTAITSSDSAQQLRFRPSPPAPTIYDNPFPGWLFQQDDSIASQQQQQQQQHFFNSDQPSLLQFQQAYSSPNAQYQIAIPQQQPDLPIQFQQHDLSAPYKQPQQQKQQKQPIPTAPAQNAFIPGTATVFGNVGLFNVNPNLQKERLQNGNLFLAPTPIEPSVHENEVPQGPQVFVPQTTRNRPQRPQSTAFVNIGGVQQLPADPTVPTFQNQDNSDFRPRRPRPPNGIHAQLENSRRPVNEENVRPLANRPTTATPEEGETVQFKPQRHPRPPSTETPSWSHPMLDANRPRKPRPPQQNEGGSNTRQNEGGSNTRFKRPRPTVPEPLNDSEHQEPIPRRPGKPNVDDQDWKPSTSLPELPQEEQSEVTESPRSPRPPPPVQELVEDDVVRPTYLRPRRPQQTTPETEPEEEVTLRPKRPRPPPVQQQEEEAVQEDVDETVNVRPRRPRPPEDEDRPRIRRPKPPTDVSVRRRKPQPSTEEDVSRRPVYQASVESEERQPVVTRSREEDRDQEYSISEQHEPQNEPQFIATEASPTIAIIPEDTFFPSATTTTTQQPMPTFPSKRRRPVKNDQEYVDESNENYPSQFIRSTSEAITTPAPTTTIPPSTTRSLINSRLRSRLNATRPRFGLGVKERLNKLSSQKKPDVETTTTATPVVEESLRSRPRTRDPSNRFKVTTEQVEVERSTFRPSASRSRTANKFSSRYRPTSEEPTTQDATRRASENIYSLKERRPFVGIKSNIAEKESIDSGSVQESESVQENDSVQESVEYSAQESLENSPPITSVSFSISEVTTIKPIEDATNPIQSQEEENTEMPSTTYSEEVVATTPAEDFAHARRVTDLTSSATAFKPLSFFSAVPADGKSRSQLSSRFTMATEDPILPLEAFFPTFPSKTSKEVGEHDEDAKES